MTKIDISLLNYHVAVSANPMYHWCVDEGLTVSYKVIRKGYNLSTKRHIFELEFGDEIDAMACKLRWDK